MVASCLGSMVIPPVRHYDFLHAKKLSMNPFDKEANSLTLKVAAFNQTFSLKLQKNQHLILATSTLHLHHAFGGAKQLHPIIQHPYHGSLVDDLGEERGWARILFHKEYLILYPNIQPKHHSPKRTNV
jgi:hypothetical protein